jgi:hypothetical protein
LMVQPIRRRRRGTITRGSSVHRYTMLQLLGLAQSRSSSSRVIAGASSTPPNVSRDRPLARSARRVPNSNAVRRSGRRDGWTKPLRGGSGTVGLTSKCSLIPSKRGRSMTNHEVTARWNPCPQIRSTRTTRRI